MDRCPVVSAAAMLRWSAAAPSSSLPFVAWISADPSARSAAGFDLGVAGLARTGDRVPQLSRPASMAPAFTAASPDSRSAARRASGSAHRRGDGAARRPRRPASNSGPGSTPSSRRNRSTEAESCRSTAAASPVAANARTSNTWPSSLSGSAATSRVASSTAVRAFPDASAPQRAFAQDGLAQRSCSRRRSPSSQAVKPGLAVDIHALEQLASEPGELDGFTRRASHQHEDIDDRPLG